MFARRLALLCGFCCLAWAQKKPVTLDAVISAGPPAPPASETAIWAPDGRSFLYRQGDDIRQYDIASKSSHELLSTAPLAASAVPCPAPPRMEWENRHVHESAIQWSPDSKQLLLEVGGDLFLWNVGRHKSEQLTTTPVPERDPKFSPDGRSVTFRRGHDLYTIDLSSRQETRLTTGGTETLRNGEADWVYPEELDLATAYWWSPDSQSIAYLQFDTSREPLYPQADLTGLHPVAEPERYPRAGQPNADVRLGVVAAAGGETRWMDTGDTRDTYLIARVAWAPDSSRLMVQRLTRVQNQLELLSLEAASGAATRILRETDPYWINVSDDVHFLENGRQFLWSSERDGFRHLYVYSTDGKEVRQLTHGPWEVTAVAGIDEKHRRVYYVSSEASPLERRLYEIGLDGEGKRELTPQPGTHQISMSPRTEYYLDTWSNLTTPPATTVNRVDGSLWSVYREADRALDQYDIRPTEIVPFHLKDGTLLYGRLIKPAGFTTGKKYPAVVVVYGGPDVQQVHNAWSGITWDQALAHLGFVIWQVDNRGSSGRGHAFESAVYHRLGEVALADQKEGVEHLLSLGFVDPARVGVYGWSFGGFMTLNCMLRGAGMFRSGIAGAPVTNWRNYDSIYTERYMGLPASNAEGYRDTALPPLASGLQGSLLLVHNYEDDNVLFQNTLQMADALERAGKPFEMMLYAGKSHGVTGADRRHLLETTTRFFQEKLK